MFLKRLKKNQSEIEPEEILLDGETAAKLEIPIKKSGPFIIFATSILIFVIFLCQTFWLEIIRGDYYNLRSAQNSVRLYYNRAPRGIIYDRNNKALSDNISSYNLLIIPADLPKDQKDLYNWVKKISETLKRDPQETLDFTKTLNKNSTEPVLFAWNLGRETLVELETKALNFSGIFISRGTKRNYIDGPYFSHLLGYLRKVSGGDLKTDPNYSLLDFIGKAGLENKYEKELKGKPGKIAVSVNSENVVLKTIIAEEALIGNNLVLSVDTDLQKVLSDTLKIKMVETGSSGAAAVITDIRSGEILALASLPSFDNNIFSNSLSEVSYQTLTNNRNWSEFNRAISGAYPSGSTIKPFIAAAALAENTIDPNYKIDDTLGYIRIQNQYNPEVTYTYRDWKAHGFVDMRRAIAVSANVYFYTIGGGYKNIKGLGIDRIEKYLKYFGFGSKMGIDLPGEATGLVPNPAWKNSVKKEAWFTGDTYNISIGQGDVLVTPLQMAGGIAAIANGGTLWKPKIVLKITNSNGSVIKYFKSEKIGDNLISDDKLKIIREGMRGAITEGSAWFLNDLPIKVAGKTGTAQVTNTFKKTNAWFTGFAPYDNPEIAIAIILEGAGEGSTAAVPVAKEVFEWYYNQNYDRLNN